MKDAAKAWYNKVVKVIEELGGRRCKLEPNIFYWREEKGYLKGILCTHVDDFCFGGEKSFMEKMMVNLRNKLKIGEEGEKQFKYIGVNVRQKESEICLEQKKYVENITEPESRAFLGLRVLKKKELTLYRSVVGQLNWVSQHTIPEIAFDVSDLSRAFKEGTTQDMRKLIKVVRKTKRSNAEIHLEVLNEKNVYWEIYADASFGNIENGRTQIGYLISLVEDEGKKCPIWWKSRKAKRVAKSTIEAEALSVVEAIEGGIYFNHLWDEIVGGKKLDVIVKTDSKTLMRAIKSTSGVSSKRLKIDISAIKETIETGEIKEVIWVSGKEQIADVLTKIGVSDENIRNYVGGRKRRLEEKVQGEKRISLIDSSFCYSGKKLEKETGQENKKTKCGSNLFE